MIVKHHWGWGHEQFSESLKLGQSVGLDAFPSKLSHWGGGCRGYICLFLSTGIELWFTCDEFQCMWNEVGAS